MTKISTSLAEKPSLEQDLKKENQSLNRNFSKAMLEEIEIRRKLLNPKVFKKKK